MKKRIYFLSVLLIMMFLGILIVDAAPVTKCEELFGPKSMEIIRTVFTIMRWAVPFVLIALCSFDFASVITSGKADTEMKTATQRSLKRAVAALLIFLVPNILNLLLKLIDSSTCGL